MVRTQIYLTEDHQRGLQALSHQTGRSQSDLIREAIDGLLADARRPDRRAVLLKAAGMWKDREDLPDLRELRSELSRRMPEAE